MRRTNVTIKQIASLAGVSRSTVSRVLTGHPNVKPATREKVERIIRELDYRPSSLAQGLSRGSVNIVALLVGDIRNPFYSEVARGVEDVASQAGYMVVFCDTDYQNERENQYLKMAQQYGFAGLIMMTAMDTDELIPVMENVKCPIVLLNRYISTYSTDTVLVDNVHGGYIVGQHLAKLGHRQIGFLGGPKSSSASRERAKGFYQAISDFGIQIESRNVVEGDLKMESGYRYGKAWLRKKQNQPTAIFAANDLMALGVMQALQEEGVRIPEDVSIVGYDDLPVSKVPAISLTTVRQPQYQMGSVAMKILLERIRENSDCVPQRIVYTPELIVRRTTAPL